MLFAWACVFLCVGCVNCIANIYAGDVVGHPYFGTQAIVDDLRKMRGFAQGCVELYPAVCAGKSMVRDDKTGLVCGFVQGVDSVPSGQCEL